MYLVPNLHEGMPKTLTILTVVDPHLQDSRETEAREGASDTWVLRLTEPGTPLPSYRGNPVPPPAQYILSTQY